MQSIQPQVIKHLFALFVATFSSVSMAQTVQIIPAAPRYLEPVYARIHDPGSPFSYSCIYAAQVTMEGEYLPYAISG